MQNSCLKFPSSLWIQNTLGRGLAIREKAGSNVPALWCDYGISRAGWLQLGVSRKDNDLESFQKSGWGLGKWELEDDAGRWGSKDTKGRVEGLQGICGQRDSLGLREHSMTPQISSVSVSECFLHWLSWTCTKEFLWGPKWQYCVGKVLALQ